MTGSSLKHVTDSGQVVSFSIGHQANFKKSQVTQECYDGMLKKVTELYKGRQEQGSNSELYEVKHGKRTFHVILQKEVLTVDTSNLSSSSLLDSPFPNQSEQNDPESSSRSNSSSPESNGSTQALKSPSDMELIGSQSNESISSDTTFKAPQQVDSQGKIGSDSQDEISSESETDDSEIDYESLLTRQEQLEKRVDGLITTANETHSILALGDESILARAKQNLEGLKTLNAALDEANKTLKELEKTLSKSSVDTQSNDRAGNSPVKEKSHVAVAMKVAVPAAVALGVTAAWYYGKLPSTTDELADQFEALKVTAGNFDEQLQKEICTRLEDFKSIELPVSVSVPVELPVSGDSLFESIKKKAYRMVGIEAGNVI